MDRAGHRRRPAYRGRLALSRAPSSRDAPLDQGRMGDVREQSPRQVLHAHAEGTRAVACRERDVDTLRARGVRRARGTGHPSGMTKTPAWRRYLRFWRSDIAEDVDDELRFHVEMRVSEYISRGMTEDDARRAVAERL